MSYPFLFAVLCMGPIFLFSLMRAANINSDMKPPAWLLPALFTGVVLAISVQFFFFILPAFRPYAWVDDWIFTVPLQFTSLSEWVKWIFAQHVDHRIPIQKIVSYLVLKSSGFDYRYMVGFNYLMAIGLTWALLYVAKTYRGRLTAGDLIIPLAILQYMNGFTQWGTHFMFLSSIFFLGLFVFFCFRYSETGRRSFLIAAGCAIIAESFTGIPGMIPATIAAIVTLGWLFYRPQPKQGLPIALFSLVLLINAILWSEWTPYSASSLKQFDPHQFALYFRGLVISSITLFSYEHATLKFIFLFSVFLIASAICAQRALRGSLSFIDAVIWLPAATSLLVIMSVAIGRSAIQGAWAPGISLHYGFLSVLIPLMSWIVASKYLPDRAKAALGVGLALFFFVSFQINSDWRIAQIPYQIPHQAEVVDALQSKASAEDLADKYTPDFSMNKQDTVHAIAGIKALRKAGVTLYGGTNNATEK